MTTTKLPSVTPFPDTSGKPKEAYLMHLKLKFRPLALTAALIIAAIFIQRDAKANVFASNIKFNNSLSNVVASPGGAGMTISYLLNEPATRGVVVSIVSGANVVRSFSFAAGNPGTLMGSNSVAWDGKDSNSNALASGIYKVSVTASATGFTNWTQTSTDTNTGYYVYAPRGIAVNTNPNSVYYGRVFVGNAQNNSSGTQPGDVDGILKANADGSVADEGQSNAGYNWIDDDFYDSPRYLRYGQDDRIYALDFTGTGVIVACDMAMTTNEIVLSGLNYTNNPIQNNNGAWGMMDVTDAGTANGRLWLGDDDYSGVGIWTWRVINGVANTNDTVGTQVVAVGGDLDQVPSGGFMTDESSNVFVSQEITDSPDPSARAMVFTNWNGVTAFTNAFWKVGSNDDSFNFIYDTALSSRANPAYVAYALSGNEGGIRVLHAGNGLVVSNAAASQVLTNLDAPNTYYGVAWDAAGNLYGASFTVQAWREFSPPGTNQATTISAESFIIQGSQPNQPVFTSISVNGTNVVMTFNGSASDAPSAYTLQSAPTVQGVYTNVTGAVITELGPGEFQATTSTSGTTAFYRVKR